MSLFDFIGNLFKPAADLVDNLHTSTEERLKLRNELASIQMEVNNKLVALEQSRLEAISKVEVAEAASTHWLRANWRPLSSIALVVSIMYFALTKQTIPAEIQSLAEIFLGVYSGGRSMEKIASMFKRIE